MRDGTERLLRDVGRDKYLYLFSAARFGLLSALLICAVVRRVDCLQGLPDYGRYLGKRVGRLSAFRAALPRQQLLANSSKYAATKFVQYLLSLSSADRISDITE
ncbi:hypothetical protein QD46_07740 [Paenibacillus polymyxa]|uniref:hypothetical protein n=1 Tax=Paenibacillus polymyxa TaxID=1406 RepID=UPI0005CF3345|nr:hypothetical protein [Paenibacillus polymyxa]KJD40531.1 hypothetical protein QD46_07740 [Paenibacillus polymyxa]